MQMIGLARLGRDAEVRYTPSGQAVAKLSLAFNYGQKDDSGRRPSEWIDASLWGDRAAKLAPHLLSGTQLCVTLDDPHVEQYQRRDGTSAAKVVARVASIEFAGSAPASSAAANRPAPAAGAAQRQPAPPVDQGADDDIPF